MEGHWMQRLRRHSLWLALLATASCGGQGPGELDPARSAVPGIGGRHCRYVQDPATTPTLDRITRAGTRGNINLWGRGLTEADTVELSIRYAMDGRMGWVEAIRSTIDPGRTTELETLVLDALDDTGPADWGVRTLVVGGDVVWTEPSVQCPPELVSSPGVWSGSPSTQAALSDFFESRGRRFPVRVALDEQGRVMDVGLLRSTYNRWIDQYLVDYVRNSRFEPKLHDGIGVASTFEFQLRFPRR